MRRYCARSASMPTTPGSTRLGAMTLGRVTRIRRWPNPAQARDLNHATALMSNTGVRIASFEIQPGAN